MWCISHSAKGTKWKKHKYIAIKDGRYVYPKKEVQKANTPTAGGTGYGAAVDAIGPSARRAKRIGLSNERMKQSLKLKEESAKNNKAKKPNPKGAKSKTSIDKAMEILEKRKKKRR